MNFNNSTTAILVFSRTITDEVKVKNFSLSKSNIKNRKVTRELIHRTICTAKSTNLPVFTSFSSHQKGDSFGERLSNAIKGIFSNGFQNVITIGNDCPNLTTKILLQANESLQKGNIVLGPDNNGGLYLLGINKSNYSPSKFIKMAWEDSSLQNDWDEFLRDQELNAHYLEKLDDVNDAKALLEVLNRFSPLDFFYKKICQIISGQTVKITSLIKIFSSQFYHSSTQLRAPPFFLAF